MNCAQIWRWGGGGGEVGVMNILGSGKESVNILRQALLFSTTPTN